MPAVQTVDEEVSVRPNARGLPARAVQDESVSMSTGTVKVANGAADDTHAGGGRKSRVFKESTEKLLQQLEKAPPPHEEGDADEDEAEADADSAVDEADEGAEGGDAEGGEGEGEEEGEREEEGEDAEEDAAKGDAEKAKAAGEWQTKAQTLEQRNRELLSELETARKTPKTQRTERETTLLAAEAAYIDEGSVPALRKFLGVIVGAAPDSKEVDAELSGLYADLTARELNVPLDQNQQALRDNARTRLLLARDKREKAEAGKKPDVDNSADAVQFENAAKYVDNLLVTKGQSGTSIADEFPRLMALAEDFDGYRPSEVLARAIRQEIMTGTLDPKTSDIDMVRIVAPKIENYYAAVAKKIKEIDQKLTAKKSDTTTASGKPKVAVEASKEQRQSHGARTLTNAAASRAPATPPKTTKQKAKTTTEKTRKDFPSDAAWREHLLSKHFQS